MKKLHIATTAVLLFVCLSACSYQSEYAASITTPDVPLYTDNATIENSDAAQLETKPIQMEEQDIEKTPDAADSDDITAPELTPYQLLVLGAGNAEDLMIEYTVEYNDDSSSGAIYKRGAMTATIFTAENMYGDRLIVREVESDSNVFYIIDNYQKVVSYAAPSNDILLYEMMDAIQNGIETIDYIDNRSVYTYALPFTQDESISEEFVFFIADNRLEKLEKYFDGTLAATVRFNVFSQDTPADAVFEIPPSYAMVSYDYPYDGSTVPPWWELENK